MEPRRYSYLKSLMAYPRYLIGTNLNTFRQVGNENTNDTNQYKGTFYKKVFGQLVLLGFAITGFTPAAYQRSSLLRPLKEISSWGELRA